MAARVLTNVRLFTGGADLTTVNNKIGFAAEVEEKPRTNFGSNGYVEVLGGLGSAKAEAAGQWEAGDAGKVDDVSWTDLGGLSAWTICPHTADVGEPGYLLKALRGSYKLGDAVGEVAPWEAMASSAWPATRGKILHPPGTARSATGTGTAVEHVAVTSDQHLYATLHVLSVSGTSTPTITVTVESDVDALFNGSETTRITFTAATARTGEILRVAGPITDTFYRATWTITGTTPSFLFLVGLAVGP